MTSQIGQFDHSFRRLVKIFLNFFSILPKTGPNALTI